MLSQGNPFCRLLIILIKGLGWDLVLKKREIISNAAEDIARWSNVILTASSSRKPKLIGGLSHILNMSPCLLSLLQMLNPKCFLSLSDCGFPQGSSKLRPQYIMLTAKLQVLLQFRNLSALSYMFLISLSPESWAEILKTLVFTVTLFATYVTLVKSLTLFKLQFCHL